MPASCRGIPRSMAACACRRPSPALRRHPKRHAGDHRRCRDAALIGLRSRPAVRGPRPRTSSATRRRRKRSPPSPNRTRSPRSSCRTPTNPSMSCRTAKSSPRVRRRSTIPARSSGRTYSRGRLHLAGDRLQHGQEGGKAEHLGGAADQATGRRAGRDRRAHEAGHGVHHHRSARHARDAERQGLHGDGFRGEVSSSAQADAALPSLRHRPAEPVV
jgi:hypothetical protein